MGKNKLNIDLGSILDDATFAYEKELGLNKDRIEEINISMISPNPYQPRKVFNEEALKELAQSIEEYGLLQPIVVIYDEKEIDGGYILIAGERRLRACQKLGYELIKAYVGKFPLSRLRELALIENIQRENLNPIELANSYNDIIKNNNITQNELAKLVSKSRTQITNTLRLLTLSKHTQNLIANGDITQGHAKILVGFDEKTENKIVNSIVGQKLSVKDTERLIRALKQDKEIKTHLVTNKKNSKNSEKIEKLCSFLSQNNIKFKLKEKTIEISHFEAEKMTEILNLK